MQKITSTFHTALFVLLLASLSWPVSGLAAECNHLKSNIKKERDLLKRRALFRQAVQQCPEDAELHYSYAYDLERSRKYEEALEQYHVALELDPTNAQAHFNMGDIYKSQKRLAEAVQSYRQGLALKPDNTRALKSLAEVLVTLREEQEKLPGPEAQ